MNADIFMWKEKDKEIKDKLTAPVKCASLLIGMNLTGQADAHGKRQKRKKFWVLSYG